MMMTEALVKSDPEIRGGEPCFSGTRVPADTLFDYLVRGYTVDYFLSQFPTVRRNQVLELLEEAKQRVPVSREP